MIDKMSCLFLLLMSFQSFAEDNFGGLRQRLEKITKNSRISTEQLSLLVAVHEGDRDHEVFSLQAKKMRIPASLTKIFTAAAVLKAYQPSHQFITQLVAGDIAENGILKGPLYLRGGGDPSFVSENMWFLVNEFVRQDISEIKGGIVVDDSLFDNDLFPSRPDSRVDRAYDAPISAMSFNWNSVNVFVRPGVAGGAARVFADPENEYISIVNRAKTTKKSNIEVTRRTQADRDEIIVSGELAAGAAEKVVYKSISSPALWSGYNLKSFLKQRGVRVEGGIRRGVSPKDAQVLAQSKSKALSLVLADLMKFSNNYVAEMLTKNLALKRVPVGTLDGGLEEIRAFIGSLGYKAEEFKIENASGLTNDSRFNVEQLVKALGFIRRRFDLAPEFMSSLPIAGIDGTLKNRMNNTDGERWIRAKTGLLTGAVGLAGFAGRADGVVLSFAFLYNGKGGEENLVRDLFDKLAVELVH